jgi:aminopeptidase N
VKRVADVRLLQAHQFPEDSGPMAHPVRPDSYVEINNFYTATVYNKGAELVRMQATLLGPELFRKATDLYFTRHDGQAVTTDDFVAAWRTRADAI